MCWRHRKLEHGYYFMSDEPNITLKAGCDRRNNTLIPYLPTLCKSSYPFTFSLFNKVKDLFCLDSCCGYITLANHQIVSKSTLKADTIDGSIKQDDSVNNGSPLLKGKLKLFMGRQFEALFSNEILT